MFSLLNKYDLNSGYYVYSLINPLTNLPFYIGKGKGKRYKSHFREKSLLYGKNKLKNYYIKKILDSGNKTIVEIVFISNIEEDCLLKEIELISKHGRLNLGTGILTNLTDGGDTTSGWIMPKETRDKVSDTRNARLQSGEIIPYKHTEEHKENLKENNPGGKTTSKKIYQIDPNNGLIVKTWDSSRQAGISFGKKSWRNISIVANRFKNRICRGFYWRWVDDPDITNGQLINFKELNEARLDLGLRGNKKVQQISLDGLTIIATWKSMCEAERNLGLCNTSISIAIKKNRQCGGFLWKKV